MEKNFFIGQNQLAKASEIAAIKKTGSKNTYYLKQAGKKDSFTLTNKSEIRKEFEEVKNQQGLIGKAWDGFKNLFGMKSGSKHVEEIIKKAEKGEITQEEAKEAIAKYKDGQNTSVDVVADVASGILSVLAFTLAVPTGGASLAIGLGLATAVGAGIKVGVKATDALTTGKEYKGKDLLYDTVTGGINGLLGPITNGVGNTVTATIGKQITKTVVKEGAEEVAEQAVKQGIKQTAKNVILNQTVNLTGGTAAQRALAIGAGMAVDGALGGATDNMTRAALNGENVLKAGVEGAIGGAIMSPIIGGGFNLAGKAGHAINNKITTKIILPDGIKTKFKQGSIGDCALLSTIDGMMNNPKTAKAFKKSITKTVGGDYNVKIGDQIVRVTKDSLSDEVLSDKTGIRIFEQAYKQIAGDIDGGFAEVVAQQFGLNPIHIAQDSITDELLDNLAKNQGETVLSFGTIVDTDGAIAAEGQRHYLTIKNIDAESKTVTLTSPVDTSKTIELSYEEVKTAGISIDGGSVKELDLPNSVRNADDVKFKGTNAEEHVFFNDTKNYFQNSESKIQKTYTKFKKLKIGKGQTEITVDGVSYQIDRSKKNIIEFVSQNDGSKISIIQDKGSKRLEIYDAETQTRFIQSDQKRYSLQTTKDGYTYEKECVFSSQDIEKINSFVSTIYKDGQLIEVTEAGQKEYTYNFTTRTYTSPDDVNGVFLTVTHQTVILDPRTLCFSQASVDGKGCDSLIRGMKKNGWARGPIQVIDMGNGNLVSMDNRRLRAAIETGTPVHAIIHKMNEPLPGSYKRQFHIMNRSTNTEVARPQTWGEAVYNRLFSNGFVQNDSISYSKDLPSYNPDVDLDKRSNILSDLYESGRNPYLEYIKKK